jgi:hypothetical protein
MLRTVVGNSSGCDVPASEIRHYFPAPIGIILLLSHGAEQCAPTLEQPIEVHCNTTARLEM